MIDSVRSGLVPLITSQPGFVSYRTFQADERTAVGVTTWQTREQGEAQRGPARPSAAPRWGGFSKTLAI